VFEKRYLVFILAQRVNNYLLFREKGIEREDSFSKRHFLREVSKFSWNTDMDNITLPVMYICDFDEDQISSQKDSENLILMYVISLEMPRLGFCTGWLYQIRNRLSPGPPNFHLKESLSTLITFSTKINLSNIIN